MKSLDKKLLRDLKRMWAQTLAIALVMAAGVATYVLSVGAHDSLNETRTAYYERHRFADIFATLKRAPRSLVRQISRIPGVAGVDARIVRSAILDIENGRPATGLIISLPDHGEQTLNRIYLRSGRLPGSGARDEVVVKESFAKAHGFKLGSTFKAILDGRKRALRIVGIALSPEFIYALGPGDVMPDDRRFGVLWMSQKAVEAVFDLEGSFNSVSVKRLRFASEADIIDSLDNLLARYGGLGAYPRKDQTSHAFLDSELQQLRAMRKIMPPIFLVVSAFLINMILSRMIALEREQIGLFKALGYSRNTIAFHYIKFAVAIASVGSVLGSVLGLWLGKGLTRLYADFFHFPFLIFDNSPDKYLLAALVTFAAAFLGGARSAYAAVKLPPAVAMAPPAPTRYRRYIIVPLELRKRVSQLTTMALRHIIRWPVRSAVTSGGISLALAVLIASFFIFDAVEFMIDVTYFKSDRQDATLTFVDVRPASILQEGARIPGVIRAEPYRAISARIRHGHLSRRIGITGKPQFADLSRIVDVDLNPIRMPDFGLVVSEKLADLLKISIGDRVTIEFLEGRRRTVSVPVTGRVKTYIGLVAAMNLDRLNRLVNDGRIVNGLHVALDENATDVFSRAVKNLPAIASITLQKVSLAKFRETLGENLLVMMTVYSVLGMLITFGVVYNSARIQLSERARELASLRVLGFTRAEVSRVLLSEIAVLTFAALPFGWALGYGLAWLMVTGFDNELMRMPFIVSTQTFAFATIVVLAATAISAYVVRRRIDRLDLVAVLKTRE
ncbi:hypothetical protein MnTg02_00276 [bacterium MnTg02]|nr:hypothetical protein MnTg02_00276 [bacterium MnTg02]